MADVEAHPGASWGGPTSRRALWEVRPRFGCVLAALGQGGSAYVSRSLLSTEDAIRVIREAGGWPVWAHPPSSLADPSDSPSPSWTDWKEMGLWGWSAGFAEPATWHCLERVRKRGLYTTAGTDFMDIWHLG